MVSRIERARTHGIIADRVVGAPDGRWVAIEDDALLTLADHGTNTVLPDPPGAPVGDVRFSLDGRVLLAAPHRFDFATRLWSHGPAGTTAGRATDRRVAAAAWSPDGLTLALVEETIGTTDQAIVWRDTATETRMTAVDHWSSKHLVLVADDSEPLVVVASTLLEVWDPVTTTVRWHGEPGRWQITRMMISTDTIFTGDAGGNVRATSLDSGVPGWAVDLPGEVSGIAELEVGLAFATSDGGIAVFDHDGAEVARTTLDVGVADLAAVGPARLVAAHAAPATGVSELFVE